MTPEQYATLKALAVADQTASAYLTNGQDIQLAEWMNEPTTVYVWRNNVPIDEVGDAITWANLTPLDAPDGTAAYTNRALLCQSKQFNLQIILQGRERVSGSKANLRAGLSDALLNVPSGAGGATQGAGWAAVKAALTRFATRAEAALATGAGTQAAPSTMTHDGNLSSNDAMLIRNAE